MKNISLITLISVLVLFSSTVASNNYPTFTEPSGFSDTCYAPHGRTGQMVAVTGKNGYANGFAGYANYDPYGNPTITFDVNKIQKLGIMHSIVLRFLYFHECGHFKQGGHDEINASCHAIIDMRKRNLVTKAQEQEIADFHNSLGFMGHNYGGTGTQHWNKSLSCANSQ